MKVANQTIKKGSTRNPMSGAQELKEHVLRQSNLEFIEPRCLSFPGKPRFHSKASLVYCFVNPSGFAGLWRIVRRKQVSSRTMPGYARSRQEIGLPRKGQWMRNKSNWTWIDSTGGVNVPALPCTP